MDNGDKKSNGALVGSIIIIVILIIGGAYLWVTKMDQKGADLGSIEYTEEEAAAIKAYNELTGVEEEIANTDTTIEVDLTQVQ